MTHDENDLAKLLGIAALLPGMEHATTVIVAEMDRLKAILAETQNAEPRTLRAIKLAEAQAQNGKPRKNAKPQKNRAVIASSYWAKLTPAQRSAEMKRRLAIGKRNRVKERAMSAKA